MPFTITITTLEELRTVYTAIAKAEVALRDYNQGTNSPDKQLGRFTIDEVHELLLDVLYALNVDVEATT